MNATVIHAPHPVPVDGKVKVFLAGSIEMGVARLWQDEVIKHLSDYTCTILNPRRPDWNADWVQSIDNPQFREQVEWELDNLERADVIAMYFDPATKSPITLMEFGLHANSNQMIIMCCPDGFWRKGNVDVVCARYGIGVSTDFEEFKDRLVGAIQFF